MARWEAADMMLLSPPLRGQMLGYVERGRPPGPFLTAVLAGHSDKEIWDAALYDLSVDRSNFDEVLTAATKFLRFVPNNARGSRERVIHWIKRGGLHGVEAHKGTLR
jgi:hypothetical protein